ncbi:enoyl-CoA hydratase/isomerase family protein [Rhodobacteraceae bacterium NNCM2]|nr:enoyl-CoA hydratase/isomerase family protein [Coraliihabitans acroporae]
MTDQPLVLTEIREGGVALVRLNRPEALNALNLAIRKELAAAFADLHDNGDVRAIVLTGNDKAFAAGADLKEFVNEGPVEIMRRRSERYWNTVAATPQPVIAAINGYAMGGGLELAMACDLIVIGETAQIGQPEIKVGIMPGAGGTQRLTRAVGKFNAMKMCLTGKPISGVEAHAMGLASDVVPDAEVLETALKLATTIARMPPLAAQAIKESVVQGANASLDAAMALERKSFQLLFATEDKTEGMTAFIEKRRAGFKGE